jgi:hypothetical protein
MYLVQLCDLLQVTMAIAREVASVTKLGVEVCYLYWLHLVIGRPLGYLSEHCKCNAFQASVLMLCVHVFLWSYLVSSDVLNMRVLTGCYCCRRWQYLPWGLVGWM